MEEGSEVSALRDNIEKKGTNSYYYAHGPKIDGPVWDGKEEPRLLERTVSESSSSKTYVPITEYSWADGKKSVTIYIDYDEAMTVSTDTLVVETNTESFVFTFTGVDNKDYKLLIDKLSNEIESGIVKQKEGQFRILLKKKEETTWFSLKKT